MKPTAVVCRHDVFVLVCTGTVTNVLVISGADCVCLLAWVPDWSSSSRRCSHSQRGLLQAHGDVCVCVCVLCPGLSDMFGRKLVIIAGGCVFIVGGLLQGVTFYFW